MLPRDVLGIHVEGVISGQEVSSGGKELPTFHFPSQVGSDSVQAVRAPAIGQPMAVQSDGRLPLPLTAPLDVSGKTLQQVSDAIREAYVKAGALKEDHTKSYVQVSLIRARTNRILVLREDSPVQTPALVRRETYTLAKRGTGDTITLTEANSDLLNALVETGGLPGEDARNEVWILRGGADWQHAQREFDSGSGAANIVSSWGESRHTVIPLRYACGKPLPFGKQDIVLHDGDVVFVEKRQEDYFYTGGLLPGGRIPLPRDEDVDILEAVALSNIGVAGPAGINASASQFRSGPGNVIPPTRAIILRKLPGGQQIKIDVDLRKAMHDSEERILLTPEDFVMLHYRGHELFGNIALNFVNVSYSFVNPVD